MSATTPQVRFADPSDQSSQAVEERDSSLQNSLVQHLQLLRYREKPLDLARRAPFEAFFKRRPASSTTVIKGRQIGMSMSLQMRHWVECMREAFLSTMIATAYHKQAQDFSDEKLDTMIDETPMLKDHLMNARKSNVVKNTWSRKRLANHSLIRLVYVVTDPGRARGEPMDTLSCDEVQEFIKDDLPVIETTLDGEHSLGIKRYIGTPLTTGTVLEMKWQESSMAEWAIPCHNQGCKKWNIPSADKDLLGMIGPVGTICNHCGRPIDPQHPDAHWVHGIPERRWFHEGYHIPQILMPWWYDDAARWHTLLYRRRKWSTARFWNEALGVSKDSGYERITLQDIKDATLLPRMGYSEVCEDRRQFYDLVVMAFDPGGKGISEVSRSACAIIGRRKDTGHYDLLGSKIWDRSVHPAQELGEMNQMWQDFNCDIYAFDYNTDPSAVMYLFEHTPDIPKDPDTLVPILYAGHTTTDMLQKTPADEKVPLTYYSLDKTRSLLVLFKAIQKKLLRFRKPFERFQDYAQDLLAFTEIGRTRNWHEVTMLTTKEGHSDDLADAINFAMVILLTKHHDLPRVLETEDTSLESIVAALGGEPEHPYGPDFRPESERPMIGIDT